MVVNVSEQPAFSEHSLNLCRLGNHLWDERDCCTSCGKQFEVDWDEIAELVLEIRSLHWEALGLSQRTQIKDLLRMWTRMVNCGALLERTLECLPPSVSWDSWVQANLNLNVEEAEDYMRIYDASI